MEMLIDILQVLFGLVLGLIGGFFGARYFIQNELKKNPPVNEEMIRAMMTSMGRTPSQKQVNQVLKQMNKYNS